MNLLKSLVKRLISSRSDFEGPYEAWNLACDASGSAYQNEVFFQKLLDSAKAVRDGKSVFERDTVLFNSIQYSWPLLTSLLSIALQEKGKLNVLDFGGGLGSSLTQLSHFSAGIELKWNIVEQKDVVIQGKKEFETSVLKFYSTIGECLQNQSVNVALFSSVLQYLENPFSFIKSVEESDIKFLIIDRLMISDRPGIRVQKVSDDVYGARIPCHFFKEEDFKKRLSEKFTLIEEWIIPEEITHEKIEKGMFWKRN